MLDRLQAVRTDGPWALSQVAFVVDDSQVVDRVFPAERAGDDVVERHATAKVILPGVYLFAAEVAVPAPHLGDVGVGDAERPLGVGPASALAGAVQPGSTTSCGLQDRVTTLSTCLPSFREGGHRAENIVGGIAMQVAGYLGCREFA